MKYVVCFSGGHGSALAAVETVYRYGRDNTILLNHDISSKVEDADVKRFKAEVAEYLGVPIIYANRDNFEKDTPLSLCRQEKMIRFRGGHSICTYYLKTKPFAEWLSENYPVGQGRISDEITLVYGFDAWERRRIDRRRCILSAQGYNSIYPLADKKSLWIKDVRELGIWLPESYATSKHANCIGCLKAGRQHWYMVYCLRPDIYWEAVETEEYVGCSIIRDIFLKDLEPLFYCMKRLGIRPQDNICSTFFWAETRKKLHALY